MKDDDFYIEFILMGASRPQTPRCFLVLDYLFSSTRKLQFYVELAEDGHYYCSKSFVEIMVLVGDKWDEVSKCQSQSVKLTLALY